MTKTGAWCLYLSKAIAQQEGSRTGPAHTFHTNVYTYDKLTAVYSKHVAMYAAVMRPIMVATRNKTCRPYRSASVAAGIATNMFVVPMIPAAMPSEMKPPPDPAAAR